MASPVDTWLDKLTDRLVNRFVRPYALGWLVLGFTLWAAWLMVHLSHMDSDGLITLDSAYYLRTAHHLLYQFTDWQMLTRLFTPNKAMGYSSSIAALYSLLHPWLSVDWSAKVLHILALFSCLAFMVSRFGKAGLLLASPLFTAQMLQFGASTWPDWLLMVSSTVVLVLLYDLWSGLTHDSVGRASRWLWVLLPMTMLIKYHSVFLMPVILSMILLMGRMVVHSMPTASFMSRLHRLMQSSRLVSLLGLLAWSGSWLGAQFLFNVVRDGSLVGIRSANELGYIEILWRFLPALGRSLNVITVYPSFFWMCVSGLMLYMLYLEARWRQPSSVTPMSLETPDDRHLWRVFILAAFWYGVVVLGARSVQSYDFDTPRLILPLITYSLMGLFSWVLFHQKQAELLIRLWLPVVCLSLCLMTARFTLLDTKGKPNATYYATRQTLLSHLHPLPDAHTILMAHHAYLYLDPTHVVYIPSRTPTLHTLQEFCETMPQMSMQLDTDQLAERLQSSTDWALAHGIPAKPHIENRLAGWQSYIKSHSPLSEPFHEVLRCP